MISGSETGQDVYREVEKEEDECVIYNYLCLIYILMLHINKRLKKTFPVMCIVKQLTKNHVIILLILHIFHRLLC